MENFLRKKIHICIWLMTKEVMQMSEKDEIELILSILVSILTAVLVVKFVK